MPLTHGKLLALDLGDQWIGVAITDASQTFVAFS